MFKSKAKTSSSDVSKQMDELLGKPPVPHAKSTATYNAEEDELLNLRVKLQQKERALADREKSVNSEMKLIENQVSTLKKTRAELWDDLERLKKEYDKYARENVNLKEELHAHKKQIKYAEEAHEFVVKKQMALQQRELSIKKREEAITQKEKEIDALNAQIKEKERTIIRLSSVIQAEKESFEKRKKSLLNEIDTLEKRKTLLAAQVNELTSEFTLEHKRLRQATHDVKELYEAAELKNAAIDKRMAQVEKEIMKKQKSFSSELDKKLQTVDEREHKIMKIAIALDQRDVELRKKEAELEVEYKKLEAEKQSEALVRKNIIELTSEERVVEQRVADKKRTLEQLDVSYQTKMADLKRDQQLLDEKEDEIVQRINQLKRDEKLLAEKEEEFVDKINELEQDKIAFDAQVEEFSDKIERVTQFDKDMAEKNKQLQKREAELIQKQKELQTKELQMIQAVEFKANISALKKEKEQLQKDLKELQSKVNKAAEINKKLTLRERKVHEYEKMLKDKDLQLQKLMMDITAERDQLSTDEFTTYFEKEIESAKLLAKEEEVKNVTQLIEEENPNNYDVLTLLQKARTALSSQNVEDAKRYYSRLNTAYKNLPANQEKKKLYYEILELKTDIELSMV